MFDVVARVPCDIARQWPVLKQQVLQAPEVMYATEKTGTARG
jgi:hypothetical protein